MRSRHRPLALVTQPDRPHGRGNKRHVSTLVAAAREAEIPVHQPANPHEPDFLGELRSLAPDVLLVASYGVIMKSELLDFAPRGALNVHASLLPRHRGASPVHAAIRAGDVETGVSIQRIVLALDEGDVLLAKALTIGERATSGALTAELARLGGEAAVEALDLLAEGRASFTPQDGGLATYARKLKKADGRIAWARPAHELERLTRAMDPWPGARFLDGKERDVTLRSARVVDVPADEGGQHPEPGTIVEARGRFVVTTGEGALELETVVPAGKREMTGAEYLRGARLVLGDRLSDGRES